ncbi:glycolate oxidase iron-sulfur subunit [Desulfotomaculum arcticum]|uniref:Glycolate oxidase iron-sulfur subunit n=1 Tax=Desulfotruncus arcticus DSM 17038 TaxID=1121424 RepID=A0A1I2P9D7_9FIRM|nr:(Fe-S)-binding protein [Desulfotruncus arcticus]SFG10071.1 glycolate oxidase iron-sulfur subunit [Desulfotomaculum arcticum] [Desulfotruncus arcticus DSM 17038]
MKDTEQMLKDMYSQTDNCIRCGRCTTVCPTYAATKREPMVARGRVRLAREYIEGALGLSEKLKLYYDLCLGCNACLEVCPPRIKVADLINMLKVQIIQKEGLSFADRVVLKKILAKPQNFRKVMTLLHFNRQVGTTNLLPLHLKEKVKILPDMPKGSIKSLYDNKPGEQKGNYRVGYFVGCLTGAFFPDIARDVVKVLNYHDCNVVLLPQAVCCGLPHRVSGDLQESRKLARKNIELFKAYLVDYIVTDCGSCGHALKDYNNLFEGADNIAGDAAAFSKKVCDINEFLVDIVGLKAGERALDGRRVTYHESCHLNRGQRVSRQPKQILQAIHGLEYVAMPEADWCCGAAGSFAFKHQDMARRILARKINHIKQTGAQYVTAGCPACLIQLGYGQREFKLEYRVKHPVQLLAETIIG